MKSPWYRDGLRFACSQCGDCCTGAPGHVWVTRREVESLASFLDLSMDEFGERHLRRVGRRYSLVEKPGGDCVFYDKGCSVYPVRPTQCRTFPFWGENVRTRTAWTDVAQECPGVGQGKLYALEEIQVIRRGESDAALG